MNLGGAFLLFRTLSYLSNIWSFQLAFDFYHMFLWKTNLFLLMLCAIMKSVESVWFIWCYLALSWESCFLISCFMFILLLVSFHLVDILFSIGVLSSMCCFDSIPIDITLHMLMCFGINHLLIWFLLNHVLIWILI